jgi:hypothetical protein
MRLERAELGRGAGGHKCRSSHFPAEVHMTIPYITPILLLCCSNIFMTFAWARSGPVMPDAKRQRRFASDERAELERGAGGCNKRNLSASEIA